MGAMLDQSQVEGWGVVPLRVAVCGGEKAKKGV